VKNWKTTAWGIAGIAALVLSALLQWHSGQHVDVPSLIEKAAGIASGIGLISAADAGIVSKILPK